MQVVTDCNGNDGWRDVEERTSGVTDTILQEPDMTENVEKIITFAPGEGNKPLVLFMEKKTLNCYHLPLFTVEKPELTICKKEFRSHDGRVAQSIPNIFYKLKES